MMQRCRCRLRLASPRLTLALLIVICAVGSVTYLLSSSFVVVGSPFASQAAFSDAHPKNLEPILDDEFEEWLNEIGYRWGMKGIAISVTRRTKGSIGQWDGWVTESKGYGIADRWGHPVDEDTLFSIGSNSKLFTALAIGMLVQDKAYPISWDTKIKDVIPDGEWILQDPSMEHNATLVDILNHRTGLPRHDLSYSRTDTPRSLISKLRYLRPSAEFKQICQYNNQMYTTAAYIIERLTNKTVQEFVTENILIPLGMNTSTYIYDEAMVGHGLADGFVVVESGHPEGEGRDQAIYKPIPFLDQQGNISLIAGPGGVISNVKDVTRWLQTLLLMGRHPVTNEQIIPAAAIERAAEGISDSPFSEDPSVTPVFYGFGQFSLSYQGHYIVEHDGSNIGHNTIVSRAPHDGIGITILTNTYPLAEPVLMELVKWRLYEKALNLKHVDWESKIPAPKIASDDLSVAAKLPTTNPLHSYTGIYSNPAYGKITMCPFNPNDISSTQIQSATHLSHCYTTISEISQAYNRTHKPDLVFSWDKYWSTHVLMSHFNKDTFSVLPIVIYPPPFPESGSNGKQDDKPFAFDRIALSMNISATFVTEPKEDKGVISGIAMKGIWGAGPGAKEVEGTSKETAEVWFDRTGNL